MNKHIIAAALAVVVAVSGCASMGENSIGSGDDSPATEAPTGLKGWAVRNNDDVQTFIGQMSDSLTTIRRDLDNSDPSALRTHCSRMAYIASLMSKGAAATDPDAPAPFLEAVYQMEQSGLACADGDIERATSLMAAGYEAIQEATAEMQAVMTG